MFNHGIGCLLLSPYRWPAVGLPGQECPDFCWRNDELVEELEPEELAALARRAEKSGPPDEDRSV